MRSWRLSMVSLVWAMLGCGGDDGPSQPTNGDGAATVTVSNNVFTPSSVTVPVNSTVTWQWNSGGVAHNVTFPDDSSATMSSGTFNRTFTAAGTYSYVCRLHPPNMTGVVTVTAGTTGGTGTGGTGGGGGGGGYP